MYRPDGAAVRFARRDAPCDVDGATAAARARMEGAAAVEKKAFVLFALCSALRERRWTPREVSIVKKEENDVRGRRG